MVRTVNICLVHERPFMNPACSSRRVQSTASCSLFSSTLLFAIFAVAQYLLYLFKFVRKCEQYTLRLYRRLNLKYYLFDVFSCKHFNPPTTAIFYTHPIPLGSPLTPIILSIFNTFLRVSLLLICYLSIILNFTCNNCCNNCRRNCCSNCCNNVATVILAIVIAIIVVIVVAANVITAADVVVMLAAAVVAAVVKLAVVARKLLKPCSTCCSICCSSCCSNCCHSCCKSVAATGDSFCCTSYCNYCSKFCCQIC